MKITLYKLFRPFIFCFPPEFCHNIAIFLLKHKIFISNTPIQPDSKIKTFHIAGLKIRNPIGLAAGFDKNAECLETLDKLGFGFVEVGTCTPKPQYGNPKPRVFRLAKYKSLINRLGFNNKGCEYFVKNLKKYKQNNPHSNLVIGANIGKNKDTTNFVSDYRYMFNQVYDFCDYITINISSPNTAGLRDLQSYDNLSTLLEALSNERLEMTVKKPIFVKLSPDIDTQTIIDCCLAIQKYSIDGVILTNSTISRSMLPKKYHSITGGLTGKCLTDLSLNALKEFKKHLNPTISVISVGGIESLEDVLERLQNGADAVQIYTSLIYNGFSSINNIINNLKYDK
jgi:dihydroorotate dehydrogenase